MQLVPQRTLTTVPAATGIVVSKSLDNLIPERLELLNQKRFAECDPNVVNNEVTKGEIPDP